MYGAAGAAYEHVAAFPTVFLRAARARIMLARIRYHPAMARSRPSEIDRLLADADAAPAWDDDSERAERLGAAFRAERGDGWVTERVVGLGRALDVIRRALDEYASGPRATRAALREREWFSAHVARRAASGPAPFDVLHAFGASRLFVETADGPALARMARHIVRLRRPRLVRVHVGDGEGNGRRHAPLARAAACLAVLAAADALWLHRVSERYLTRCERDRDAASICARDRQRLNEAIGRGLKLCDLRRGTDDERTDDPVRIAIAAAEAVLDWCAETMLVAARQADVFFADVRPDPDGLAALRIASRNGHSSAEWRALIWALLTEDPDVVAALDAKRTRALTEKHGLHSGPLAAAAIAVEKLTGIGASTIEGDVQAARKSGEPIGAEFFFAGGDVAG